MKYVCMAAGALMTLIPALAQAQNSQFTKCHSLETSGNFIGPDEALVNGMVCKVAKGKSNSSSSDAADAPKKPTEGSLALLGLIEPDILRAKEKAKAKQAAAAPDAPTAEANPEAKPNGSAATNPAEAPAFGTVFQGSLGAIARGYRNNGAGQATAPEAVIVDGKKTLRFTDWHPTGLFGGVLFIAVATWRDRSTSTGSGTVSRFSGPTPSVLNPRSTAMSASCRSAC